MKLNQRHKIVLVDDHTLIRKGIIELINNFENYIVIWEASNGKEFLEKLKTGPIPEIVILDIAMPVMDGFETARFLKIKHPEIKILVLSVINSDEAIIKMHKIGINGYVLKDAEPFEFKIAIDHIIEKGYYYSESVSHVLAKNLNVEYHTPPQIILTNREIQFLEFVAKDFTYKEIADKMSVCLRTVDGYRDSLFYKLNVNSKVGLAIYAFKNGYIKN